MKKNLDLNNLEEGKTIIKDFADGQATFYSKIPISDNIFLEDETGFLYCKNSIVGNVGVQKYLGKEIGLKGKDGKKVIEMVRLEDSVFNEVSMASYEGKPITLHHPDKKVNSKNYKDYIVGSIKDVKRDEDNLSSDIVLYDAYTIDKVQKGEMKDLSLGYRAKIVQMADGRYKQTDIVINHLAIVEQGRAINAQIVDNKTVNDDEENETVLEPQDFSDKIHVTESENHSVRINTYDDETHEETTKEVTTYESKHTHYEVAKQQLIDSKLKNKGDNTMEKDFKYFMAELKDLATYPKGEFRDAALKALSVECKDTLGTELPTIEDIKQSVIDKSVGFKDTKDETKEEPETKTLKIFANDEERYFKSLYRKMDNPEVARKYASMDYNDVLDAMTEGRTL